MFGFLLADSVEEGCGLYQQADEHSLQDLAHGTAVFNVDLLASYTQVPNLVGQPVVDPRPGAEGGPEVKRAPASGSDQEMPPPAG